MKKLELLSSLFVIFCVFSPLKGHLRDDSENSLCLDFTWKSTQSSSGGGNSSSDLNECGQPSNVPCSTLLDSASFPNPPTSDQLEALGAIYNCPRQTGQSCMKYTLYNNDADENAVYISRFCGKAVDDTDNVIVDSGCHYEENAMPGTDAEICVCGGSKCNTGSTSFHQPWWILMILATFLLRP